MNSKRRLQMPRCDATVFDLYGLTAEEKEVVMD